MVTATVSWSAIILLGRDAITGSVDGMDDDDAAASGTGTGGAFFEAFFFLFVVAAASVILIPLEFTAEPFFVLMYVPFLPLLLYPAHLYRHNAPTRLKPYFS